MAKKKDMVDDERPSEPPAEVPEPEPESPPTPIVGRSQHLSEEERHPMVAAGDPHGASAMVAKDAPGPKSYYLIIDGVRCVHVGDTADGRWIYRPD